jgi:hypothetical protein
LAKQGQLLISGKNENVHRRKSTRAEIRALREDNRTRLNRQPNLAERC